VTALKKEFQDPMCLIGKRALEESPWGLVAEEAGGKHLTLDKLLHSSRPQSSGKNKTLSK
jgi:hypothetical protein